MAEVTSLHAERSLDGGIVRVTAVGRTAEAVATAANEAAAIVVEDYRPTDDDPLTPAARGDRCRSRSWMPCSPTQAPAATRWFR